MSRRKDRSNLRTSPYQIADKSRVDEAVRVIRANPTLSLTSLGNRFGVSAQAIKQVREGTTWKHVQ